MVEANHDNMDRQHTLAPRLPIERIHLLTTSKIGRDARTGEFRPVEIARRNPATHVVETIRRTTPPPSKPTPPRKGK